MTDPGSGMPARSGHLDLAFERSGARSHLVRRHYSWPFTVGRSFYLDDARTPTVVIQTVSGTLNAGDRSGQAIRVGEGARARIVGQGAVSVHGDSRGTEAGERVELTVEAGGRLVFSPEPRILFPGSVLQQSVSLEIAEGATAVLVDSFVVRTDADGNGFRGLATEVAISNGPHLLVVDRLRLDGWPGFPGSMGGFTAHAQLFLVMPGAARRGAALPSASDWEERRGVYAAVSELPNEAGWSARIVARDGLLLRDAIAAWLRLFEDVR